MKNLNTTVVAFFVALALSFSGSAVMADPGEGQGLNFFGKEKDLFVFRTAKGTSDAKVEIYSDSGKLVTAQTMQKRKIIIDFGGVAFGMYTIRVTQNGVVTEYQYERK
ncbi:MAG TPA: T9SS type A sorting domain-containing protein [Cyclobacteriaceae bacterium]